MCVCVCVFVYIYIYMGVEIMRALYINFVGGARSVMVIVVGNRHGDTSSNPGRD